MTLGLFFSNSFNIFSLEEESILGISNFMACSLREITRLKGVGTPCTRFRAKGGPTLNAMRYQFGQLNDPHLQGVKHVICLVISVAAASSSHRAVPLPPRYPAATSSHRNPGGWRNSTVSIGLVKPCYTYSQLAPYSHIVTVAIFLGDVSVVFLRTLPMSNKTSKRFCKYRSEI